jgi:hypothetical protein
MERQTFDFERAGGFDLFSSVSDRDAESTRNKRFDFGMGRTPIPGPSKIEGVGHPPNRNRSENNPFAQTNGYDFSLETSNHFYYAFVIVSEPSGS